jgi:bacteriocin-like protein
MADEKEKAIEKDQKTIKPTKSGKDELREKDLENVSGGGWITLDKW